MSDKDTPAGESAGNPAVTDEAMGKQVAMQKVYLRDASLEVPNGPGIFTHEWKPKLDVEVDTRAVKLSELSDQAHEVTLSISIKATLNEQVAYLAELDQVGLFLITGFDNQAEYRALLGAWCPTQLFPFAREAVADLIQRSGFPHFLLQPINFDSMYQQRLAHAEAEQATAH